MKQLIFGAALAAGMAAQAAAAGPVARACMAADREAANRALCSCIEQVARPIFTRSELRRIVKFFKNPELTQKLRSSDRAADERFWDKYQAWGEMAQAQCG